MNKRIEKIINNLKVGKITVRRDQLKKAIEENAFDYMIYRGYDEVYDVEPIKSVASVEAINTWWWSGAKIWASLTDDGLKVTMSYGYSYIDLYTSLNQEKNIEQEKNSDECERIEDSEKTQSVEVVINIEKNGIELYFDNKPADDVRENLKVNGFKWSKYNKCWYIKDSEEARKFVRDFLKSEAEANKEEIVEVEATKEEAVEKIEVINQEKIIIHIEGEGSIAPITTNSIEKATKNLNDRILVEYAEECGGYSKTYITISDEGEEYKFRYDLSKNTKLATNLIEFIIAEEKISYNYTIKNIENFSYINEEEYKKEYEELFLYLESLLEKNQEKIDIINDPFVEAVEKINDTKLYKITATHEWIISDSRLIKNDYCNGIVLATGKAIKEFIEENVYINPFDLKEYTGDLQAFKEGLKRVDNGKLITLFPTSEDVEMSKVKMLPRLERELLRVV